MSRTRLTVALSISLVLIGGACWFRFVRIAPYSAQLVAVDDGIAEFSTEETFLKDIYDKKTSSTTPPAELSHTDLVGRQLFSDYIELASRGQTSSPELDALASKYAESVLKTDQFKTVESTQIITVVDSEENFLRYSQSISNLRGTNKALAEAQYYKSGANNNVDSPGFKSFMSAAGKLYRTSAEQLLSLEVPISLAENHRALANNYLGTALAMETLGNISADSLSAYAALNTQAKNSKEEGELLLNIQLALMANGVILEYGL